MNEYQLASARLLLRAMSDAPDEAKDVATLRRYLPEEVVQRMIAREAEYRQFNRDVAGNTACLSPDATGYWADFQKMLRYGRLHWAAGDFPGTGKVLSAMCERLDESFEYRVPDNEKGKFQIWDSQRMDAGNYDPRWEYCRDTWPPILRPEYLGSASISNPKGRAQVEVLSELFAPPPTGQPMQDSARLREIARRD